MLVESCLVLVSGEASDQGSGDIAAFTTSTKEGLVFTSASGVIIALNDGHPQELFVLLPASAIKAQLARPSARWAHGQGPET